MFSLQRSMTFWALLALAAPCVYAADNARPRPPSEQEYWAQFERRDWDRAIVAAEKLVETARQNSNTDPLPLAEDLALLGSAQFANKNLLAAEAAYSEALQILEPRVAPTSDKLLEPLRGMGYTLANAGKYDAAIPYLERALLVSRRTNGLFNLNQQGILRQLASSFVKLGNYPDAEQQMQYLLRVGEHTYGARDPRIAGIHILIGDFYSQAGLVNVGRDSYRQSLQIVEKKLGKSDLATVEPLRAYADSFRSELFFLNLRSSDRQGAVPDNLPEMKATNPRYLNVEGERALKRALNTLDAHPSRPPTLLFETLLDLGDWYTIKSQPDDAMPYYRRAVSVLNEIEPERRANAQMKVSFPVQIYYAHPQLATRNLSRSADEVEERFVQVSFTVGADGAVRNERVVDQDATPRQVAETLAAIHGARYRPRFANGEPVDTEDLSMRQIFKQRKERGTE